MCGVDVPWRRPGRVPGRRAGAQAGPILMRYSNDGRDVKVGDWVLSDGDFLARVVCDFDARVALPGYEHWLVPFVLEDGTTMSAGILVESDACGLVYYATDEAIVRAGLAAGPRP